MRRLTVLFVLVGLALGLLGTAPCGHCETRTRPARCHHDGTRDQPAPAAECGCLSHDLACSPSRGDVVSSAPVVDGRPLMAEAAFWAPALVAHRRVVRVDGRASPPSRGLPVYLVLHALLI